MTPVHEVVGGVELHDVFGRQRDHHHPATVGFVPEHLGVAEVRRSDVEHRIAVVPVPGTTAIVAGGEALRLPAGDRVGGGVDGHHGGPVVDRQPAGVPVVDDDAAGEYVLVVGSHDRRGQFRPVHEVGADGM